MPAIRLPAPDGSLSKLPVEKQVQALTDLVMRFRRELEYLLNGNLDEENGVVAADMIISQKRIGGLQAVRVPHFPPSALMVTRLDNLSIYYQEGARRRHIKDVPEKDQIENYESSNDAYVVEDYGCAAVAENITFEE